MAASLTLPLSDLDLAKWMRFGENGGLGKGLALQDRLAETQDELMFLQGEELIILLLIDPRTTEGLPRAMQSERGVALAYCEQVVGLVRISDVRLLTRLKDPVIPISRPEDATSHSASFESETSHEDVSTDSHPPAMTTSFSSASESSHFQSPKTPSRSSSPQQSDFLKASLSNEPRSAASGPYDATSRTVGPAFSFFDIPVQEAGHAVSDSQSTVLGGALHTPAYDRLLGDYAQSSRKISPTLTPSGGIQDTQTKRPVDVSRPVQTAASAAESLGNLLIDADMSSLYSDSASARSRSPNSPTFPSVGPAPEREEAKAHLAPAAPRSVIPPLTISTKLAADSGSHAAVTGKSLVSPTMANLAPLRVSRSHSNSPSPRSPPRQASIPPGLSPSATDRSPFFDGMQRPRSPRDVFPAPVHIATARLAALSMESLGASSTSTSLSSLLPSPTSLPSAASKQSLRDAPRLRAAGSNSPTSSFRSPTPDSPTMLRSASSPGLDSPPRKAASPKSNASRSPIWSHLKRSASTSSSHRPLGDDSGVQAIGNVEFEMVSGSSSAARISSDTGSSSPFAQAFDATKEEPYDQDFISRPSPEERRHVRQSMLMAETGTADGAGFEGSRSAASAMLNASTLPAEERSRGSSLAPSTAASPIDVRSLETHRNRELRWVTMMSSPIAQAKKGKKLKTMCREGIPSSVRAKAWCWLADVPGLRQPGLYHALCEKESPIHNEIDVHITTCYPPHSLFASANSPARVDLASVLKAFACFNPAIGFNRELGYLAGILLLQAPAEDVFYLLVAVTGTIVPHLYDRDQTGFRETAFVCGHLLAAAEPDLAKKLMNAGIDPRFWTAQWILPIFSKVLPWEALQRILDCFLLEGMKLLYRVALSLFDVIKPQLESCAIQRLLECVMNPPRTGLSPPHDLLAAVFTTKIKDSQLKRLMRRAEVVVRQGHSRPTQ